STTTDCTNWGGRDGFVDSLTARSRSRPRPRHRVDARSSLADGRVERPREPHELRRACVPGVLRVLACEGRTAHAGGASRGPRGGSRGPARADGAARAGDARLRPVGHDQKGPGMTSDRTVVLELTRLEALHLAGLVRQFDEL